MPYLISAGDPQSIEKWDKDLGRQSRHDGVGDSEEPKGNTIEVWLCWRADDRDARHEAGGERHGDWHSCHLPSTQEELSTAGLLSSSEGLEKPDACWGQNDPSKHYIVPNRERGHWTTCTSHGSSRYLLPEPLSELNFYFTYAHKHFMFFLSNYLELKEQKCTLRIARKCVLVHLRLTFVRWISVRSYYGYSIQP